MAEVILARKSWSASALLGALAVFLRRHSPLRRGNLDFVTNALNHDAPVRVAEPFEVERVRHVFRRVLTTVTHGVSFVRRDIMNADFARGREVANHAGLIHAERSQAPV